MSGAGTTSVFPRPSFEDLIAAAQADLTRLPNATFLRRSVVTILAYDAAALASGEYDYIDWAVVNALLPWSATGAYADRWANIARTQRRDATPSQMVLTVPFTAAGTLPVGFQWQMGTTVVLTTTEAITATGAGNFSVPVEAVTAGSAGNLAVGTTVNAVAAQAGVSGTAVVASITEEGEDQETDAELRARYLPLLANPPQGGAAYDYVTFAKQVSGVTRVWVYPLQNGPGTVSVTFVMDGLPDIIPTESAVDAVQEAIQGPAPADADGLVAFASTSSPVAVTVTNLVVAPGFTQEQAEANIDTALAALFATVTPGGFGWDGEAEAFLTGGSLALSQIFGAINNAAGVTSFDLAAPTADQLAAFGILLQLGAVSLP
jgi:uncharacterized phage protein gp47/JayE